MESNPVYAKNTVDAPASIPLAPKGKYLLEMENALATSYPYKRTLDRFERALQEIKHEIVSSEMEKDYPAGSS